MILDNNTVEMINMSNTMTPAEFAVEVDSDGRTVRKFLRSITPKDEQPGKGSRWALPATKREVTKLQKQFKEWSAKQAEDAAKRAQAKAEEAAAEVEVDEDELLDD
jgi:hypothetical protein